METLVNKSNYKILNYKHDLQKLYDLIFKFCSKNNVIISNYNYNISKIKQYKYELVDINNDFNLILFSFNPKKVAVDLVNEIYNNYSKYCFMNCYIFDKEINISIDNMKIINIYLLFEIENKLINKINFLEYNNNLYLPNYIELFHIAHKLYQPSYFLKYIKINNNDSNYNEYDKLQETPITGYNLMYVYTKLINTILSNNTLNYKNYVDSNSIKSKIITKLFNKLLNIDSNNLNLILLDINSIEYLLNDKINSINNLYFILNNLDNNIKIIKNIIDKIIIENNIFDNYEIIIKKSSFYIYNDFRLKKYLLKIQDRNTNKIYNIITFFNSTDYELIPIVKEYNKIKIPHPIVIIRFLLLNLISLQLFDKNYNNNIYLNFVYNLSLIKKISLDFNTIYYEGIYIDDKIDKFKIGSYVYRPWQYFLKNKSLLSIQ